uniref:Uncharacterized protein n=1 Tax=Arundo donax TaxID=35708 RepID=A0A0A9GSU6_ARUDO
MCFTIYTTLCSALVCCVCLCYVNVLGSM